MSFFVSRAPTGGSNRKGPSDGGASQVEPEAESDVQGKRMATSEPRSSPPTEPSGKGRRRTPRRPRSIEVTCRGAGNAFYPGRSVDLSRGGAQVEFEPGRWLVPEGKEGLGVFTEVLRGHLPDGLATQPLPGRVSA